MTETLGGNNFWLRMALGVHMAAYTHAYTCLTDANFSQNNTYPYLMQLISIFSFLFYLYLKISGPNTQNHFMGA